MSSIQGKTIRPGALRYSYYQSGARPKSRTAASAPKKHHFRSLLLGLALIAAALLAYGALSANKANLNSSNSSNNSNKAKTLAPAVIKPTQKAATAPNPCASNPTTQLILVSILERHLWACNGPNEVYSSAVVTGDTQYADTLTPTGTYHIYAKETDRTLTGSDENGSWHDFVQYWMPFLFNQYGAYGLHDATWRAPNAFGNIDPNSASASNGCVELPLASAKWLYDWVSVGTTVTIES